MGKTRKGKKEEPSVKKLQEQAQRELLHWQALKKYGGSDPVWPDGVNMNLTRNHIIYANRKIAELANVPQQLGMFGESVPMLDNLLVTVPPEVSNDYMADVAGIKSRAMDALKTAENSSDPHTAKDAERLREAIMYKNYIDMRRITYLITRT